MALTYYNQLKSLTSKVGVDATPVGSPVFDGASPFGKTALHVTSASNYAKILNPLYAMNEGELNVWYAFDNAVSGAGDYDALFDHDIGERFFLYRDAAAQTGLAGILYPTPNFVAATYFTADTKWHFLQILWSVSKTIAGGKCFSILVDGAEKSSSTENMDNNSTSGAYWMLGVLQGAPAQHALNGRLSNLKIWNTPANYSDTYANRLIEDYGYSAPVPSPVITPIQVSKPKVLFLGLYDLYDLGYVNKIMPIVEQKTWERDKLIENEYTQEVNNFDNSFSEDHPNSLMKNPGWRFGTFKIINASGITIWDGLIYDIRCNHNTKTASIVSTSVLSKYLNTKIAYQSSAYETAATAAKNIMDAYGLTSYDTPTLNRSISILTKENCYIKAYFTLDDGLTIQSALEKLAEYSSCDCFIAQNKIFFKHTRISDIVSRVSVGETDMIEIPATETLIDGLVNDYRIFYSGCGNTPAVDASNRNIGVISRARYGTRSLPEMVGGDGSQVVFKDITSAIYIGESYIYRTHKNVVSNPKPLKRITFAIEAQGNLRLSIANSVYFDVTFSDEAWTKKMFELYEIESDDDENIIRITAIEVPV